MDETFCPGDRVRYKHGRGWVEGEIVTLDEDRAVIRTKSGKQVTRKLACIRVEIPLSAAADMGKSE